MINIERSIDVEDEVRKILKDHLTVYCRPLPAQYSLPNILVTQVGGSDANKVDTFEIVLDARATREAAALEYLRNAVGVLRAVAGGKETPIRHISVNTSGSWGTDPVREDLALCSARLEVVAHLENTTII